MRHVIGEALIAASDQDPALLQLVTVEREKAALQRDKGALQSQLELEWAARKADAAKAAAAENAARQAAQEAVTLTEALEQVRLSYTR